jgi:TRAP-type C4-dicarboxylate transport system substrate-binding protein
MYSFLDPRLGVVELPFMFNNNDSAAYTAIHALPLYDQILQEKFNAKGLGLFNLGFLDLLANRPIKTLEDWKGLMVGAISPPVAAMVKGLGGSPVTIMWTDFYESLQKKVIDGATNSMRGHVSMNLIDVCKHYTVFYGVAAFNGFSINLDVWNKMPKHIQQLLQEEVASSVEWFHKTWGLTVEADDVKTFKQKGVSIYTLPSGERERWVQVLTPLKEKQLASLGVFGQKVKQIADEANKRYPYSEHPAK